MTKQQEQQQKIGINPNPTYIPLSEIEEVKADLEQARIQIETLKNERDSYAGKINTLDREAATLKDELTKQQQINANITQQFKDLYLMHEQLLEQCLNTTTAMTITNGKLGQAIVNYKFVIPTTQQE